MIKLENFEVLGWEHAIRGMRNPMNSWDKSDSGYCCNYGCNHCDNEDCSLIATGGDTNCYYLGKNDYNLMMKLSNAGTDHRKFMRMITVYVDITAPLYWWKEFDTYKVGTVVNSCSTMHKIHEKEFTLDDFSHEKLFTEYGDPSMNLNYAGKYPEAVLLDIIHVLNNFRWWYNETKDKRYWDQMIQLLPTSYNQRRTVMLNYEVLANMYKSRKNHKLDEWHTFCDWIESLPYSELITGKELTN
jgi:hypothetical protein